MTTEPLILTIETATLAGSIALVRGDQVIGGFNGDPKISHSNTLLADLDKLLSETNTELAQIDLFAVAAGPGSFTGLRIGIATVKALAATLDRSCAAIPTLHAVALSGGPSEKTVALLPAGRGEVFAQLFSVSGNGVVTALDEAAHVAPAKMIEKYGSLENVLWCGEGANAQRELIENAAESKNWRIASSIEERAASLGHYSLAQYVSRLALQSFRQNRLVAPDALQAIYVRPSDAELKVS